ncbi:hypothetical protein FQN50_006578 [Emmonsiellopsis sp. PD_5]|nr:hypothetical protein FQN50_006578 [Emmonsiellopsis sp. PD_5]
MGSAIRRRRRRYAGEVRVLMVLLISFLFALTIPSVDAGFVEFENCLPPSTIQSDPVQLQFKPMFVWASLDTASKDRNLTVTVYGNVTGIATQEPYPLPDDPRWSDPNETLGKIVNVDTENNNFSTLFTRFEVLSYTPYIAAPAKFCESVVQGECPLGPVFYSNGTPPELRAFSVSHDLNSSYALTSIAPIMKATAGDAASTLVVCVSAEVVPDLGSNLSNIFAYVPLVILILVGIATISAATFSPWGSLDIFRWTSNYGRDEDLLRLVTPGFADCLQYIQFILLTGSLTLNYPGYYQPVVSQVGWSALMFNESFVSHGNGTDAIQDGVYSINGTYGLDRMSQLSGMSSVKDIWAGMVIWLLVLLGSAILLIQLGFALRSLYRKVAHVPPEDLRSKNLPFTVGNVVRIIFNYFLLPIVSLSMFQLVVTRDSPIFTVALAVVLLVSLIGFAIWLLLLITKTRPRSYLFDDLPTVLLYGPLYNTFSDGAAPFSVVSVLLTFVRGIAIGAVQPSGIAQIVLLAICEVILILTLSAFRPFPSPTSMNAYHSVFSIVRCLTILLSVAFVPSLRVSHAARGWIGYVILFMHAMVLIFGFFLNAIQTLVEVLARLAGAGGEGGVEGGAARGGLVKVFGMRQLSRRVPRKHRYPRHSVNSEAAMLGNERPSTQLDGDRARSFSGSSALLLNRSGPADSRVSAGFEAGSVYGAGHRSRGSGSGPYTPTTLGGISPAIFPGQNTGDSGSPRSGLTVLKHAETADPYYRPPRQRRATLDGMSPVSRRQDSWTSGDWTKRRSGSNVDGEETDVGGGGTPIPAYLPTARDDSDPDMDDSGRPRTDYAVREVDFYYRVRGPALSHSGTRRLKTGPGHPTGPVSSATGWFRGIFGGKTKEKGKGFEVVRSARAPPPGLMPPAEREMFPEPYRDDPETSVETVIGPVQASRGTTGSLENQDAISRPEPKVIAEESVAPLPPTESGEAIELPRRVGSRNDPHRLVILPPTIPRKSSKRHSSADLTDYQSEQTPKAPTFPPSENSQEINEPDLSQDPEQTPIQHTRLPFGSKASSTKSDFLSTRSTASSAQNATDDENSNHGHKRHKSPPYIPVDNAQTRPQSMGYVQKHRASDNIHMAQSDIAPFSGSSAEIVRDPLE